MKAILILFALLGFNLATAHEGHDHDGPSMVQAPKGGIIKSNETHHIEVISKGKDLKIYLYTKDLKPADLSKEPISAEVELPRTKKTEAITLTPKGDHYVANYDAKGAHRYTLAITFGSHKDKFNFTVEPKK